MAHGKSKKKKSRKSAVAIMFVIGGLITATMATAYLASAQTPKATTVPRDKAGAVPTDQLSTKQKATIKGETQVKSIKTSPKVKAGIVDPPMRK